MDHSIARSGRAETTAWAGRRAEWRLLWRPRQIRSPAPLISQAQCPVPGRQNAGKRYIHSLYGARNGSLWRRTSVRLCKSTWTLTLSCLTLKPFASSLPHSTLLGSRLKEAG